MWPPSGVAEGLTQDAHQPWLAEGGERRNKFNSGAEAQNHWGLSALAKMESQGPIYHLKQTNQTDKIHDSAIIKTLASGHKEP